MSGQDALEELLLEIQDAIQEELMSSQRPRLDKAFSTKFSVRDLGQQLESNTESNISRTELLESWQTLVQTLSSTQVFLQYTPQLERFFVSWSSDDDSYWEDAKTLLELMTETVKNHDKDESTECRYVTLMEVLTTYGPNWQFSQQVERLWETQDQYLDDPAMSPEEFRQTAYGVLMLLPWVPNSAGLRQACSIPDDESLDEDEVPWAVESVFNQIRSSPLPRHDAIHRILSHLETEDNAIIAISSTVDESFSRGIGKTTMAAMVASSPSVHDDYDVLWLRFKHRKDSKESMTYHQYVEYLNTLCDQLSLERDWSKPMRVLEERALQKKREEEKMFQIKNEMAEILRNNTSDLLLILDDVQDDQDIEWFRFLEHQSFVVTTRSRSLSVTWTLDVELLTEDEALELFLTEGDYSTDDALRNSLEVKSIVQRCGYHPLTIRLVARWFSLKEATVGVIKALEELDQELSTCTAKLRYSQSSKGNQSILNEVMNHTLSPVLATGGHPTSLMKICLSSMAIVFEQPVLRDVVLLLWGELLQTEPQAVGELGGKLSKGKVRKRARFLMDALLSLGILTETEKDEGAYIEIFHEAQLDYAKALVKEIHFGCDATETAERWHNAFVTAYLATKADNEREGLDDPCQEYAIEKLALHMIQARKYKKATKLLSDARFLVERYSAKDYESGTRLHLDDCKELLDAMESDDDSNKDPFEVVAAIQTKVAAFIISEIKEEQDDERIHQAGMAIHDLAFALAENGFSPEAVVQYKNVLKVVPKRSLVSSILLYGLGALNMIRNEPEKSLKNLNECLKGMVQDETSLGTAFHSEALLLKGDALMAQCDYEVAMHFYDESLDTLLVDPTNNRFEIALAMYRKGMLHYTQGEQDEAMRALMESIDLKLKFGESSANLATAYYFVGHIFAESDRNADAIENLEKALRTMKENLDEVDSADIYLTTGKLCELRDDIDGTLDAFDVALKAIREAPRVEMDRVAHDFRSIACASAKFGDFVGAVSIFDEGLDLTDDRPSSLERASLLFELASCEFEQGDHEDSVYHLEKALKIRKDKLKASSLVVQTFEKLGSVYQSTGKPEEALSYYTNALEYTEASFGEDNEKVASLLFMLGDLKESTHDNVEALANFEECLEMRRRNLEITSVLIAETLERIGSIYMEQGALEKAYPCFAEALDIRQASSEPDNSILVESYYRIGIVARKHGDSERALHFLMDALRIREMQEEDREMCETLLEIGHVHRQLGDFESSRGCYEKCLEVVHEKFGKSDSMAGEILLALGQVYRHGGDADKAKDCFDEGTLLSKSKANNGQFLFLSNSLFYSFVTVLTRFNDLQSRDNGKVAVASWNLGVIKYEMDEYEEAMKYLGEFVKIQDAKKVRNTIEYVVALQVTGDIHHFLDDSGSASSMWSAAFNTYSSSKEMVSRYPDLGPMLERRVSTSGEDGDAPSSQPESMLQTITANLVGQLSDEVSKKDKVERDPREIALVRTIFLGD